MGTKVHRVIRTYKKEEVKDKWAISEESSFKEDSKYNTSVNIKGISWDRDTTNSKYFWIINYRLSSVNNLDSESKLPEVKITKPMTSPVPHNLNINKFNPK